MLKLISFYLLFIFILFENIITTIIKPPKWFNYWDESIFLLLLGSFILELIFSSRKKLKKNDKIIIYCVLLTVLIGIVSNFYYGFAASMSGIGRDIVQFIKFPLTFVIMRRLYLDRKMCNLMKYLIPLLKYLVIIMTLFGVFSLVADTGMSQAEIRHGIHPYQFLYGHPTTFVFVNVITLAILGSFISKNNMMIYDAMIFINIVLSMRTKAVVWIGIYLFMKYGGNWLKKYKILYWTAILIIAIFIGFDKVVELNSFSNSTRMYNYIAGIELMMYTFPLGGGFATFASQLAVREGSGAYDVLSTPPPWHFFGVYNLNEEFIIEAGDTGYPYYFAQFGIIGLLLFVLLMFNIFKLCYPQGKMHMYSLIMFLYFVIALTTEASFMNAGLSIGIVLAIVLYKEESKSKI